MGLDVSLWGAVLAGLLSFVSPCILPIVPPYLCFIAGVSFEELAESSDTTSRARRRIILSAIAFALGSATVFVALGASASVVGQTVARHFDTLRYVAGAIILVMGLHFMGVVRIPLLYRQARIETARQPASLAGAYIVGLAFAFGWTPCVGPVLAAILFTAGAQETASQGALLLAAYALGICVPFVLAAVFATPFLGLMRRLRRHMGLVEKTMGVLLVLTGVLFITNAMSVIAYWMLEYVPALG